MTRTFTTFTVFVFAFLYVLVAQAEPVADGNALGRCVHDCEAQLKLICFDEANRDITVMCATVASCKDLSAGDKAAASALFGACYEGTINNCPANCPPADGTATTTPAPPKQVRQQPPPKRDQCKAAGGFYITEPGGTEKFCFTHQGFYNRLVVVEQSVNEIHNRVKALENAGKPVTPEVRREIVNREAMLVLIKQELAGRNQSLQDMAERIARQISGMLVTLNDHEQRIHTLEIAPKASSEPVTLEPALVGWSLNPYFTVQAFDLYDEAQYAGGLELGLYPALSTNGRHRVAINLGFGKAANYIEKSMVQHHLFGGYGYYAHEGSVAVGLGVNRYSLTDVQQGRLFWVGPEVEGKINIADLSDSDAKVKGTYLFLGARVGVGYRYGRHGILDPKYEPVQGRFDVPFTFGIGVQGIPIL
jgi:hypothetical protein